MPCWHCKSGGGSVYPLPIALLASPPVLWGVAVGAALAAVRDASVGYSVLGAAEGGWGGGARLVLIPCRCANVAPVRSTLVREAMPCRGSIVAALNQSRNGATRWVISMASAFTCIICHMVAGARKGEIISGWTRERRVRYAWGTETLSFLGVSGGRCGCTGARRANKASIFAACGTTTSAGVSHFS